MKNRRKKAKGVMARACRQASEALKRLDQRVLQSASPQMDESRKAQLLAWVHHHLMVPVIIERDRHLVSPLPSEELAVEAARPSLNRINIVALLLSGAVGVDEHLAFRNLVPPPPGWEFAVAGIAGDSVPPAGGAVAAELVGWLHRRLTLAAQRTRLHSDEEIQALLGWAEAELILCALGCFHLDQYLGIAVPPYEQTALSPTLITLAARGHVSIEWTPDGPVSTALTPPPGLVIG